MTLPNNLSFQNGDRIYRYSDRFVYICTPKLKNKIAFYDVIVKRKDNGAVVYRFQTDISYLNTLSDKA